MKVIFCLFLITLIACNADSQIEEFLKGLDSHIMKTEIRKHIKNGWTSRLSQNTYQCGVANIRHYSCACFSSSRQCICPSVLGPNE